MSEFHYVPTGTGVISGREMMRQTEDAINNALEDGGDTREIAEQALANSETALQQSGQAVETASAAQTTAEQAQTSAANAVSTANQANATAQTALSTAQQASTTATNAVTAAQAAQTAAENAASDAADSEDIAAQALTSAQAAQNAASAAQTAAETAQTDADQSATLATQAQSAAAQSAQSAAQAASVVAASARQIGEIVTSTLPLSTVGLHLLDGALIDGDGIYAAFVEYVSNLDQSANFFCTEAEWQQSITDSGMCGKFVYDSVANSVRLPKLDGAVIQGDIDIATLGDLVNAGLDSSAPTQTVKSFIYIVIANSVASSTPVDLDEIVEKALDAVTITEDQTITGVKTFSNSPLVPTASADDFSEKSANTAFVQTRIRKTADELQKQINALEGVVLTATENSAVAYTKQIPTSANLFKYAAIRNYGGKSIVWNQLLQNPTTESVSAGQDDSFRASQTKIDFIQGHKYLFLCNQSATLTSVNRNTFLVNGVFESQSQNFNLGAGTRGWIKAFDFSGEYYVQFWCNNPNAAVTYDNFRVHDLTLMFGVGNEPSTVADFLTIFPNDIPAFNAWEIKSAGVNKIVSAGANLLSESDLEQGSLDSSGQETVQIIRVRSGFVSVNPAEIYSVGVKSDNDVVLLEIHEYDARGNFIDYTTTGNINSTNLRTSANCFFVRVLYRKFGNGKIVPAEVVDPYVISGSNQQFVPYTKTEYPIPSAVLALPGYGWSAGTAFNEVDWENKKYIQRVGHVDLGTLDWDFLANNVFRSWTVPDGMRVTESNVLSGRYSIASVAAIYNVSVDKALGIGEQTYYGVGKVIVRDTAYSSHSEFMVAMSGVPLYYELETPIITDISNLIDDNAIEVESGGFLTFENTNGDDYRIPVPSSVVTMEKP